MTSINTGFCRMLLATQHAIIKRAFPDVKVTSRDVIGCVGPHGRDQYFVEIRVPGYEPFDHYYSADNAYHAKALAWGAFFDKYAPQQIKDRIEQEDAI